MGACADHAVGCPRGPLRNQRHENVADDLADFMQETGAHVRRDVYVAEFSTAREEAWLDVWGFGTVAVPDVLVDVTIRHPADSRYQPGACSTLGHAAAKAEEEKQARYPCAKGRMVTPFAVESWGRLGAHAEALLIHLAAAAARRDLQRGRVEVGRLQRWRARLDATVQRGIARALVAACEGLPGRAHQRHAPHE